MQIEYEIVRKDMYLHSNNENIHTIQRTSVCLVNQWDLAVTSLHHKTHILVNPRDLAVTSLHLETHILRVKSQVKANIGLLLILSNIICLQLTTFALVISANNNIFFSWYCVEQS